MQKWNVRTDWIQIDGVTCLLIMFTQEDLPDALKRFAQAVTSFLLSTENAKKSHVLHFNSHNSGIKLDFYHL